MPSGITGASITSFTNATTADGPSVSNNDLSLKTNGVNNDGGTITTDGSGNMTVVSVSNGQGIVRGMFFLSTPYLLLNSATINSGSVSTQTCTGVGTPTIPSATVAILISCYYTAGSAGAFLQMYPHGATVSDLSNYPILGIVAVSSVNVAASAIVPLSGGQIDIKANNANCTGIHASIYGYLY